MKVVEYIAVMMQEAACGNFIKCQLSLNCGISLSHFDPSSLNKSETRQFFLSGFLTFLIEQTTFLFWITLRHSRHISTSYGHKE